MVPSAHDVPGPSEALAQIADVVCPCSAGLGRPFSVTEMDVIREVYESETEVGVVLELTDPTCPFGLSIADAIESRLAAVAGSRKVTITFTFADDDLWSEERMGKAASERLRRIREDDRAGT